MSCAQEGRFGPGEAESRVEPEGAADEREREARALLARIAEPADPRLGELLDDLGPVEVLAGLAAGALRIPGAAAMRARLEDADGAAELERGAAAGARFVCPGEDGWPTQLDDLGAGRPFGLWVRGELPLRTHLLRSVALVGSRAATAYGLHVSTELAAGVAERGWAVVSGCAFGIDAAAHRGALAVGGVTVGVLAGGVDVPYPRAHESLIARIVEEGALLSEAAPGAAPARRRFLTRNRVIAALSRGTVVVEAALRSGAATTARWADDLGRPLMAVPGPVTSTASAGAHELIRSRHAVLVTRAAEIVEAVGSLGEDLAPPLSGRSRARDGLPTRLLGVIEALPTRGPSPLPVIARECGLELEAVQALLGELAGRGLVERVDGGWRLTRAARASRR
jgi:DNA processing protein